jgi:nardilysin
VPEVSDATESDGAMSAQATAARDSSGSSTSTGSDGNSMAEDSPVPDGPVSPSEAGEFADDAPRSLRAAVAMVVGVGSFSDPPDMQGLSHYLEHMLFMGSEDFPGENEYDDFLVKHAGSSNAYTDAEYTNFHFDVEPSALHRALQRFSAFFKTPLCLASALEREARPITYTTQIMRRACIILT